MEEVIEFYVPKRFRKAFVRADQAQPGKVIEFCSRARGHCVAAVRYSVQPCCKVVVSLRARGCSERILLCRR